MLQAADGQDAERLRNFLLWVTSLPHSEAAQTLFSAVAGTSPQPPMTEQMDLLAGIIRAYSYGSGSVLSAVGPGPSLHFVPGFGPVARMSAASIGPASSAGSVITCDDSDRDTSEGGYLVEAVDSGSAYFFDSGSESEATVDGDVLWVAPDPAEITVIGVNVGNLADGVEEERVEARVEEERNAWRRMRLVGPVTRSRARASPY